MSSLFSRPRSSQAPDWMVMSAWCRCRSSESTTCASPARSRYLWTRSTLSFAYSLRESDESRFRNVMFSCMRAAPPIRLTCRRGRCGRYRHSDAPAFGKATGSGASVCPSRTWAGVEALPDADGDAAVVGIALEEAVQLVGRPLHAALQRVVDDVLPVLGLARDGDEVAGQLVADVVAAVGDDAAALPEHLV